MRLFYWSSQLMKEYRTGYILVLALDVEEARDKARARFDPWLAERRSWLDHEDDAEEIAELRALLEADLAAEPTEDDVHFILGGE